MENIGITFQQQTYTCLNLDGDLCSKNTITATCHDLSLEINYKFRDKKATDISSLHSYITNPKVSYEMCDKT